MLRRRVHHFLQRLGSVAILAALAFMFVVVSCHGKAVQFDAGFGYHPVPDSCEEHVLTAGEAHTEKSLFDSITLPELKILLAVLVIAAFTVVFPKLPERYSSQTKNALVYHQRKRWVWARNLPFSSVGFFPYFAAVRDH